MRTLARLSALATLVVALCADPFLVHAQSGANPEGKQSFRKLQSQHNDKRKVHSLVTLGYHYVSRLPLPAAKDSANAIFRFADSVSIHLKYDSGKLESRLGLAQVWIKMAEHDMADDERLPLDLNPLKRMFDGIASLVKTKQNFETTGETYYKLAMLLSRRTYFFDYRIMLFDSAAFFFHQSGNRNRESETWRQSGESCHQQSKLDLAVERYYKSIEVMQGGHRKGLSDPYSLLGNIFLYQGNYKKSLELLLVAYDLAEKENKESESFGWVNLFLGLYYKRVDDLDLALKYYQNALQVFEKLDRTNAEDLIYAVTNACKIIVIKSPSQSIQLMDRIVKEHPMVVGEHMYVIILNERMIAYARMKDYAMAQKYCDQVVKRIKTRDLAASKTLVRDVIDFLVDSRQYVEARKYLALYQPVVRKEKPALRDSYYVMHRIDSAEGKFEAALINFTKFKLLSDSLLGQTKLKEIAELKISYESEKKEQSIALLTKDAQIKDIQLVESRFARNIIIGGALILFCVLILVFTLYRKRKQIGEDLQVQKDEIDKKNLILQRVIGEKEWLVKEVHHRIKNNLHTIVSLLESQSFYIKNREALSAIQDSQSRIHSMSLIHQKLYQSESNSSIAMGPYVIELLDHLKRSLNGPKQIFFEVDVDEISLGIGQSIPIGLMLNEAITNSLKYAFPTPGKDRISVRMKKHENRVRLVIADNGIGLPPNFDRKNKHQGLGLQLIHGLTAEIGGELTLTSEAGLTIDIEFKVNDKLEQIADQYAYDVAPYTAALFDSEMQDGKD
ncbi:histidine kinase dimerization/phosphoacceptor domain -containing protein [Chryseolinea lacunae]|uniref:histidine kinase n=1 Tax=Chryseolinea lacunae TaxID=2801331 RepID=A0ABS1KY43_9BACT|nr:histidine kinase dimerization/phosphoacceptor domain -containing protein [Chryseolinea lacunae]MBL0744133.1 ATP-binding protein [Chryseolinea lacunae]